MIIGAFEENGLTNSETVLFARRFLKEKRGGVMKELKRQMCVWVWGGGGGGGSRRESAVRAVIADWRDGSLVKKKKKKKKKSVQLSSVAMRSVVCSLIEI